MHRSMTLGLMLALTSTTCLLGQLPKPPFGKDGEKPPFKFPKPQLPKPPFGKDANVPPPLADLLKKQESADSEDRLEATEELEQLQVGAEQALGFLMKGLQDQNETVRTSALNALSSFGTDAAPALPQVKKMAREADNEFERVLAASVAAKLTNQSAQLADLIPSLAKSLQTENPRIANMAADALAEMGLASESAVKDNLTSNNPGSIQLSLDVLGKIGARDSVGDIAKHLSSQSTGVRAAAAEALANIGPASDAVAPQLRQTLSADPSPAVRARAANALGSTDTASADVIQTLLAATKDKDAGVASEAIAALGKLPNGNAALNNQLGELLNDKRSEVVSAAMLALVEQGEAAVPVVRGALQDPASRYWGILVAGELGSAGAALVPDLTQLLATDDALTNKEVLLALAKIGPDSAAGWDKIVPKLSHNDEGVRYAATFAVGTIAKKDDTAQDVLKANLRTDSELMKLTSAWALVKLNPRDPLQAVRTMPILINGLHSKDESVRQAATQCLADLKPTPDKLPQLLPELVRTVASPNEELRSGALDALEAALGNVDAGRVLKNGVGNQRIRPIAAQIIQRVGPKAASATTALADALDDDRMEVRRDIALALAAIGPDAADAVPALSKALQDDNEEVKRAAVFALGSIGSGAKSAIPNLQAQLSTGSDRSRGYAAWALAQIGADDPVVTKKIVPLLAEGLKRGDARERLEVARTLEKLGPASAAAKDELEYATKDPERNVREAAKRALEKLAGH